MVEASDLEPKCVATLFMGPNAATVVSPRNKFMRRKENMYLGMLIVIKWTMQARSHHQHYVGKQVCSTRIIQLKHENDVTNPFYDLHPASCIRLHLVSCCSKQSIVQYCWYQPGTCTVMSDDDVVEDRPKRSLL